MALVRVCCVCKRTEHNGEWANHDHHKEKKNNRHFATHGFCTACFNIEMYKLEKDDVCRKRITNHKDDI